MKMIYKVLFLCVIAGSLVGVQSNMSEAMIAVAISLASIMYLDFSNGERSA